MSKEEELHSFQCNVCGYVYKSKEEELPDDFVCPLCEAHKDHFSPVVISKENKDEK